MSNEGRWWLLYLNLACHYVSAENSYALKSAAKLNLYFYCFSSFSFTWIVYFGDIEHENEASEVL